MSEQLLFGFHAVLSRLRQRPESVRRIYVDQERRDPRVRDLMAAAEVRNVKVSLVERKRLDGMAGQQRHQGVAAEVEAAPRREYRDPCELLEEWNLTEPPLLLVLDGVTDPHNLGACLRNADAFGAHAVIAPKDRAVGLTPTVAKVASGAAETVPFISVTNLARTLRELKEFDVWVVGTTDDALTELKDGKLTGPLAWVLGAEGEGMRRLTREACDQLVKIPMQGTVESLNVSVASGICLYETSRQRG